MRRLILINRNTVYQFVKFSLIGFLNVGIHYAVFISLLRFAGVYYLVASTVGYTAGLINSFILNKNWTFKTKGGRLHIEFIKFVMVNLAALLINIGSLWFFVSHVSMTPEFGQIIAIVLSLSINFLGNKFWTFRQGIEQPL